MCVYRGSLGIRTQQSRPRRFRLVPKSTAADVGISRFIWFTIAPFAAPGRHSVQACKRLFALCVKRRLQAFSSCPPFTSIGWGQGYAPPPHFLSAGAMIRVYHRKSNVHRGLRWVAPPAPPLLRVVCSASVVAASSRLPAVECRPRPVALSLLPPTIPPPTPPVPPSHTPRGDNNRLGHYLSAGASNCGARLRPRPPL